MTLKMQKQSIGDILLHHNVTPLAELIDDLEDWIESNHSNTPDEPFGYDDEGNPVYNKPAAPDESGEGEKKLRNLHKTLVWILDLKWDDKDSKKVLIDIQNKVGSLLYKYSNTPESGEGETYIREECVFKYCPHPEYCKPKNKCLNKIII